MERALHATLTWHFEMHLLQKKAPTEAKLDHGWLAGFAFEPCNLTVDGGYSQYVSVCLMANYGSQIVQTE